VAPDVHVAGGTSTLDAISSVFGAAVKRELLPFAVQIGTDAQLAQATAVSGDSHHDLAFSASGYVSNANYSSKKSLFILFINNRLVECHPLKKALDVVYAEFLPKHTHPFVYLSITIPPQHVDVNVHPTKREVNFLFQEELIEAVTLELGKTLRGANASRTFYTQATLTVPQLSPAALPINALSSIRSTNASSAASVGLAVVQTVATSLQVRVCCHG
jgi:DNA mismatch repair protein MLH1